MTVSTSCWQHIQLQNAAPSLNPLGPKDIFCQTLWFWVIQKCFLRYFFTMLILQFYKFTRMCIYTSVLAFFYNVYFIWKRLFICKICRDNYDISLIEIFTYIYKVLLTKYSIFVFVVVFCCYFVITVYIYTRFLLSTFCGDLRKTK
jgi:hypothetical protein